MAVSIKAVELWRSEVANKPGTLAAALTPLAEAGADLRVVMGYRFSGRSKAAIEVFPVKGRKAEAAARAAGLARSGIPTLLIEGDNEPGLGSVVAQALADAGINLAFFMGNVIGAHYSALAAFESQEDQHKAQALIRKAVGRKK